MSSVALRQLGLGTLKQIYRLDPSDLSAALQNAGRRRITEKRLWDALLYRTAVLGSELRPVELALAADAVAKARHKDRSFEDHLLREVRAKARSFLVRDGALLLNAMAKLAVQDELLTRSLMPSMMRRIGKQTRLDDLALLSLSLARLGDPCREPICDQIVAAIMPRIGNVSHGQTLSLLACAFTLPPRRESTGPREPLFADEQAMNEVLLQEPCEEPAAAREMQHVAFVEAILEQCERHMWNLRSSDVLHLALALSAVVRSGNSEIIPSRMFRRLHRRMEGLFFEFQPAQFVRLLDLVAHLPELDELCTGKLLDEVSYRIRDVTPVSCIPVLRAVCRKGGHPQAHSAVAWRLAREDASQALLPEQVCEVAESLLNIKPWLWEGREALLGLLQGLAKRKREPRPEILVRLLRAFGEMSIRDTHWFHLCVRLYAYDPSTMKPVKSLDELEPLEETVVANAVLALARLNLPQLVDASMLFSRAAVVVKSENQIADVLEAAGLFCLIRRTPSDLKTRQLRPLVAALASPRASEQDAAPLPLRLFPFSATASSVCDSALLQSLREEAVRHSAPREPDEFQLSVGRELASWPNIGLTHDVRVGPLSVPWAANLVGLAEYLKSHPLQPPWASDDGDPEDDSVSTEHASNLDVGLGCEGDDVDGTPAEREGRPPASRRAERRRRASAKRLSMRKGMEDTDDRPPPVAATADGEISANTHILVELLRDADFYHASASIRSDKQRSKRQLLSAERFAELSLLRQSGWRVCCIPEHLWSIGPDGDVEASEGNKRLFFRLVANLSNAQ